MYFSLSLHLSLSLKQNLMYHVNFSFYIYTFNLLFDITCTLSTLYNYKNIGYVLRGIKTIPRPQEFYPPPVLKFLDPPLLLVVILTQKQRWSVDMSVFSCWYLDITFSYKAQDRNHFLPKHWRLSGVVSVCLCEEHIRRLTSA